MTVPARTADRALVWAIVDSAVVGHHSLVTQRGTAAVSEASK